MSKKQTKKAASHRKSAKRVAAGRKAWRTKVRHYGSKAAAIAATVGKRGRKTRGRKGGKKTRARRGAKAAGHRLVRYNRLAARIGKRAAHAQVYGRAA